jgi:cell division initiation protein
MVAESADLSFKEEGFMRIAPIDIAHKTFGKKVLGVDAEEVQNFLRDIADQMEEIIRERNALKEALREKEMSMSDYRDREDTLKSTITTATKMSEQIRIDAEREARLILQDAQQKAELIIADARDSLKRIYAEISDLKRSRIQFDASLRSLLHAHLSILDQSHTMLPDPQITVGRMNSGGATNGVGATAQAATQAATQAPMQMPRPTQTLPK